jgi:mRNA interferase MazF
MKKGEIWIIDIPGFGGHEQKGRRPAILLADTVTSIVMIIPCTSNVQALRFPFTLRINASKSNGLEAHTIALVLQLRAIDKKRLVKKIGVLEQSHVKEINRIIKQFLGL